uniref:CS1 type fimbrial major subunit n=1 Tax=Pseudomonas sp. TaxID=306 RepID=UPI00260BC9CB
MFKKFAIAVPLAVMAMNASLAFAADDARSSINITASIPTKQFHAQPRDPNWGKDETMAYNPVTGTLGGLRQTYDFKNTEGSINAYIQGGLASLTNGTDSIALDVKIGGVTVGATPVEVVDDATSNPGTQADMTIAA